METGLGQPHRTLRPSSIQHPTSAYWTYLPDCAQNTKTEECVDSMQPGELVAAAEYWPGSSEVQSILKSKPLLGGWSLLSAIWRTVEVRKDRLAVITA